MSETPKQPEAKIAGFTEKNVDDIVEKVAAGLGLTADQKDAERIAHDEETLIKIFEAKGTLVKPGTLDNLSIGFAKLAGPLVGVKAPDEAYVRRVTLQYTAKAIAAERGDDLGLGFIDNAVIPNSERAQKIYRDYLKQVVVEQEKEKPVERASAFSGFDNAHPSDHGGSISHFQEKARTESHETHHGAAI